MSFDPAEGAYAIEREALDPIGAEIAELEMTAVGVEPVTSLIELCQRSDLLSMHAPLNSETLHMMGEKQFKASAKGTPGFSGPPADRRRGRSCR